jgi:hypothetical protein
MPAELVKLLQEAYGIRACTSSLVHLPSDAKVRRLAFVLRLGVVGWAGAADEVALLRQVRACCFLQFRLHGGIASK